MKTALLTLIFSLFATSALACEDHDKMASNSVPTKKADKPEKPVTQAKPEQKK